MTDIGEDPRGMNKTAMQDFLVKQITKPDSLPGDTDIQITPPADEEKFAGETPAFVSSLSAVLQLQWWTKQVEMTEKEKQRVHEYKLRKLELDKQTEIE